MGQFFDLHAMVFGFSTKQTDILKVLNLLPDDTKEKLMRADDMGIFRVIKPQPIQENHLPPVLPLENLRPLLGLMPGLSFEWGAE